MFIDKDSIKVKTSSMADYISLGYYLVQAEYEYNKLWGNDSGRNLAGEMSGSLIGIFPKLILQFRKLTEYELKTITPILDSSEQSIQYYDPTKQATVTISTYTGDYRITNKNIISGDTKNEGFSCSFISKKRRT